MKNLVIVESPAKAKTIEKFLGKDYTVKSSFGHIRDLPSKGMSIDINNDFEPQYAISPDKKKVVSELKKAAKEADTIWLASDEDREGEAIAWHLAQALNLSPAKTKRIVFHEITKTAIVKAIEKPRDVDADLVDAQQARRVLDRLVGYELSPVLWKKVKRGLSAGRVQSVAVRLIVEREREIDTFEATSSYKLAAELETEAGEKFEAEGQKKLEDTTSARAVLEDFSKSDFTVSQVESSPGKRSPSAPFTTSTLQQEASRRLGYSVKQTMSLAQRLYEAGHITYMRTDSLNLSEQAIKGAESFIRSQFGEDYLQTRRFKTKNSSAQEAHEAIRPTVISKEVAGADDRQKKLYNLIRLRTIASQMSEAKLEKTTVKIAGSASDETLVAKGEVLRFPGFLALMKADKKDDVTLPDMKEGDKLKLHRARATETFTRPPARYSEAALVRKLEEMGIGRPSTYAPTISTIQDRGYVEKREVEARQRDVKQLLLEAGNITEQTNTENTGGDKGKLLPTDIASVVTDFLIKHFPNIVDYDFTANVEGEFDTIAEGDLKWQKMIANFYHPFHKQVEAAESIKRSDAGGMRNLGNDPETGKPVFARLGRYGPMIQLGETESEEKPTFAPMPKDEKIETITLERALEMFALPRTVGKTEDGKEITASIGPYGPYLKVEKKYTSLKEYDPLSVTEEQARQVLAESKMNSGPIAEFNNGKIKVLRGRYGPYVSDGKINAPVPKSMEPEDIDEKTAKELLEKKAARGKKTAKK